MINFVFIRIYISVISVMSQTILSVVLQFPSSSMNTVHCTLQCTVYGMYTRLKKTADKIIALFSNYFNFFLTSPFSFRCTN